MRETSALYKRLWAMPHSKEIKVDIAGVEYSQSEIFSCRIYGGIYDKPTIGTCSSRTLSLKIMPKGTIPRGVKITVYARLAAGGEVSEWITQGEFYISLRPRDKRTGALNITAYDAMLKANAVWLNDSYDAVNWPMAESEAVADIANRMGVAIDRRTELDNAYPLDYPVDENGDMTMWNVLSGIAVSNCGSWVITPDGKLRLLRFGETTDEISVGAKAQSMDIGADVANISRVNLVVDSEHMYTAGNDTGRTMEVECPWGTQTMANSILAGAGGVQYKPYTAERALLDLAFEFGDAVTVGNVSSWIVSADIIYNAASLATIAAPDLDEIDDEYPAQQTQQSSIKRQLAYTRSLITKTAEEIRLEVAGFDGRIAAISVGLEEIETEVADAMGSFSKLQQTVNGFEASISNLESGQRASLKFGADGLIYSDNSGTVTINGNQIAANTVKVNSLYGSNVYFCDVYGNIAADIAVTGASSTAQQKAVLSSGAFEVRTYGGSVYLSSNTGPALLLGPGPGGGTPYCQLTGGPLVIDADSYGPLSSRPSSGTYGQVYFALE